MDCLEDATLGRLKHDLITMLPLRTAVPSVALLGFVGIINSCVASLLITIVLSGLIPHQEMVRHLRGGPMLMYGDQVLIV